MENLSVLHKCATSRCSNSVLVMKNMKMDSSIHHDHVYNCTAPALQVDAVTTISPSPRWEWRWDVYSIVSGKWAHLMGIHQQMASLHAHHQLLLWRTIPLDQICSPTNNCIAPVCDSLVERRSNIAGTCSLTILHCRDWTFVDVV